MKTRLGSFLLAILLASGCGDDVNQNTGGSGGGGTSGSGGSGGSNPPDGSTAYQNDGGRWICPDPLGQMLPCACSDGIDNDMDGRTDWPADPDCPGPWGSSESSAGCGQTQCTDCIDNDGDGKIDSADPECTGPLDNDESSFATGIPGDNRDACKQDCFFDGNSGQGDDRCEWDVGCDPILSMSPRYANCHAGNCSPQSQQCIMYCGRLVPNGCDCFGCCTVFVCDSSGMNCMPHDVSLQPGCTVDRINDPTYCPSCTKSTDCNNPCDPCEWCLGRPPTMNCMPDGGTYDGGGTYMCPNNEVPCNPIDRNCPPGFYCLTGCCIPGIP